MATKTSAKKSSAKKKPAAKQTGGGVQKTQKGKIATFLVVLAIAGFIALAMNVGNLAKAGIEKIASDTLGVKVSIGTLDISLQDKQIEVTGLRIGNPEGYKNAQAMSVDTIRIAADSITKELLTFNEITVSGTNINLEVTETGTNLTDIRKNVDRKASQKQAAATGEPVKVIVRQMNIEQATLNPSMVLAGGDLDPVVLPDIKLNGIGQRSGGVLVSEAIAQVLESVTAVATRSAAESGFLQGMDQESLKNIQQSLGLPTGIMDQVKGLGDKMRGIFGN